MPGTRGWLAARDTAVVTLLYGCGLRMSEALGLGHAVLCSEAAVGHHPFAVILPDDLIRPEQGHATVFAAYAHASPGRSGSSGARIHP